MLPDTAPRASPSRSIPRTHRYIHTPRQCDTASPSHLVATHAPSHTSHPRYCYTDWAAWSRQDLAHRGVGELLTIHAQTCTRTEQPFLLWLGGAQVVAGRVILRHQGLHMGPVLGDNRCPGLHLHSGRRFQRGLVVTLSRNYLCSVTKKITVNL